MFWRKTTKTKLNVASALTCQFASTVVILFHFTYLIIGDKPEKITSNAFTKFR